MIASYVIDSKLFCDLDIPAFGISKEFRQLKPGSPGDGAAPRPGLRTYFHDRDDKGTGNGTDARVHSWTREFEPGN
jgi:hypothetical protein